MKAKIIQMLQNNHTYKEIANVLGCSFSTISYHATKIGISRGKKPKYNWTEIATYYETHTRKETIEKFGFASATWTHAVRRGDLISRGYEDIAVPDDKIFCENSTYNRTDLKNRIIKDGIVENICAKCNQPPVWNNELLVLQIDHKNGINNDNRKHNLQLLCPNCHTQTPTFAGRNIKNK